MARRVSIGYQEFEDIIINDLFYVDKTQFIKEWWERRISLAKDFHPYSLNLKKSMRAS